MQYLKGNRLWLYQAPVDFRKQMYSLAQVVATDMEKEPDNGDLYIFRNRTRTKGKLLKYDRNGYFLGYKTLSKGRFDFPVNEAGQVEITEDQLTMLLSGMPMVRIGVESEKENRHHF